MTIDLNLDAGEDPAMLMDGREAALYDVVSSINIACGGHAGDEQTMRASIRLARVKGLAIGAHPSYPDRDGFGRRALNVEPDRLRESLREQIQSLMRFSESEGTRLTHVKAHGALYNRAAADPDVAQAIIGAVQDCAGNFKIVGLAESRMGLLCRDAGIAFVPEAFVDRRYEDDGKLRDRKHPDALIEDPQAAADQAVQIVSEGRVMTSSGRFFALSPRTLCIHGDTKNALRVAMAVRAALDQFGARIKSLV